MLSVFISAQLFINIIFLIFFIFFYFSLPQSSFGSFSSLLTFCPPAPVELTTNIVDNSSLFPLSCLSHTLSLLISLLPLSYRPFFSKKEGAQWKISDIFAKFQRNITLFYFIQARIAQFVAIRLGTGEVPGSNPGKGENFSVRISNLIVRI